MRKTKLKRAGKRVRAWESERQKLKVRYLAKGITTCQLNYEGCFRDNFLSFAHARARRWLKPHELGIAILCCTPCHEKLDLLPDPETYEIVASLFEKTFG